MPGDNPITSLQRLNGGADSGDYAGAFKRCGSVSCIDLTTVDVNILGVKTNGHDVNLNKVWAQLGCVVRFRGES